MVKLHFFSLEDSILLLFSKFRSEEDASQIPIPEDVMKLELHFEKPPPLHNDDKVKRAIVKDLQSRRGDFCDSEPDCDKLIHKFFDKREEERPHGNVQYRVLTKKERDKKKFNILENDSVCKFGCSENKLIKWCAKCNDREKLRQKNKQLEKNIARLNISEKNGIGPTNKTLEKADNPGRYGISSLEELRSYIDELTLNEIEYEHLYAEGITLTIADLLLYSYMYHLLVSKHSL